MTESERIKKRIPLTEDQLKERALDRRKCTYFISEAEMLRVDRELHEEWYTTLSNKGLDPLSKSRWEGDPNLEVFKLPKVPSDLKGLHEIRLTGTTTKNQAPEVYFWDSRVLHDLVAGMLGIQAELNMSYVLDSDVLNIHEYGQQLTRFKKEYKKQGTPMYEYMSLIKKSFKQIKIIKTPEGEFTI